MPGSAVVLWFQDHEDTVFSPWFCVFGCITCQESHPSSVLTITDVYSKNCL